MDSKSRKYAENLINELLAESVDRQKVINAIQKRREVKIKYNSNDRNAKGKDLRVIQPVAYGLSKAGNEVVRAFQPFGSSETDPNAWKTFRLDRIDSWSETRKVFDEPPGMMQQASKGRFNKSGDKTMSRVLKIADFGGAQTRYERSPLKDVNDRKRPNDIDVLKGKLDNRKHYNAKDFDYIQKNIDNWTKPKNFDSVWDMQQAKGFGDEFNTQTSQPITKNNTSEPSINTSQPDYDNAMNNGPVLKGNNNR